MDTSFKDLRKLDELKQMVSSNPRNYMLVVFGLNVGLRIGDLLRLKVGDVKNKTHVTLREVKTKKERCFKLNSVLRSVVDEFIVGLDEEEFLFKSREGGNKPISRYMAYKIIKAAALKVGLSDIGTHSLRKSMAFQIYDRTKDIGLVMSLLNHSSPKVTLRYIGITQQVLDDVLEMNSP